MGRLSKDDWFAEGFRVLEEEGFSKITIEHLCGRLGVSKGSFYHHFKSTEGYVQLLMEYWLEQHTLLFIKTADVAEEAQAREQRLYGLVANASQKVEFAIRAWGFSNPTVRGFVSKVDSIRLQYLVDLHTLQGAGDTWARQLAMLEYATLVGLQQLFPDVPQDELAHLQATYTTMLDYFKTHKHNENNEC